MTRTGITRRSFLAGLAAGSGALSVGGAALAAARPQPADRPSKPAADAGPVDMSRRTKELQELRFGMFVCWSFSTFSGQEWTPGVKSVDFFKATGCDTDQWCRTAREAGMGYILFLTKHHDGFCLWDTKTTDRKVTANALGIDVLARLRASCEKHGLKLALYFSEGEFSWANGGRRVKRATGSFYRDGRDPELKKAQMRELLTQYGPIEFLWLDHAIGDGGLSHPETVKLVKSLQPGCFVGFNNGDQTDADIHLGERGRPTPLQTLRGKGIGRKTNVDKNRYRLGEFTYPILPKHRGGAQWFYSLPKHDNLCTPAEDVYRDYLGAGKYGNIFSLDVGPRPDGRLRDIDVRTLQKVGRYIRGELKFAEPKPEAAPVSRGAGASASGVWDDQKEYAAAAAFDGDPNTRWGAPRDSRSGWLAVDLGKPVRVGRAVVVEGKWDRVRKFQLQCRQGDTWKTVAAGTKLGGRANLTFDPVTAQHFRLNILKAVEVPTIHEFELYEDQRP